MLRRPLVGEVGRDHCRRESAELCKRVFGIELLRSLLWDIIEEMYPRLHIMSGLVTNGLEPEIERWQELLIDGGEDESLLSRSRSRSRSRSV